MKSEKENILIIEKNSDGVLKLTLNDDQNKNSLSELMIMKLISSIEKATNQRRSESNNYCISWQCILFRT